MHNPRSSPRNDYLQKEKIRVEASPTIANKFPELKSLTVDLAYYDQAGRSRASQIKYTVNLEHAKSAFQFGCHNHECVGGNFDLSVILSGCGFTPDERRQRSALRRLAESDDD